MAQNTSSAVMQQRVKPAPDELDFFPTPPWATRALMEHVVIKLFGMKREDLFQTAAHEPACGEGHMLRPLREYFSTVIASDCHHYENGDRCSRLHDFLMPGEPLVKPDFIITNPPFLLAAQFIGRAIGIAGFATAMLVRTSFLEGVGRYKDLFSKYPPQIVAQFVERVPMVKGRLDSEASTATSYVWILWINPARVPADRGTRLVWIPPCRKKLERPGDYL